MKRTVGIVGWRGMVGSVLVERMLAERDFERFEPLWFSTSQAGGRGPAVGFDTPPVGDARDVNSLGKLEIVVSCQGGDYTNEVHGALRRSGWKGFWIDAASALRMEPDAVIVLDPVNRPAIEAGLAAGVRDWIGGNCTVSLMLMAMHGLFRAGWVEWLSAMTYQAASGAGAKQMRELVAQMRVLGEAAAPLLDDPASSILGIDRAVSRALAGPQLPQGDLGAPLAASLIAWIDRPMDGGQTREEWKGHAEANKILGLDPPVPIDGICVRIGAMRCHSQAIVIKLRRAVPLDEVVEAIGTANDWVRIVPNDAASTVAQLSPAAVSGTLSVPVGRIHALRMGPDHIGCFTVGDQLLWGAAEPLRRMVHLVLDHLGG